jgi:hypothetical protein
MRRAVIFVSLIWLATATAAAGQQAQSKKAVAVQLRVQDASLHKLIDAALAGSATFREIAASLDHSSVIVYTRYGRCHDGVPACLEFVTAAPPYVYVRATVDPFDNAPWRVAGLLAHELQHARELSGAHIASLSDFVAFYEAHGWRHYTGFETDAAAAAGRRVEYEMATRTETGSTRKPRRFSA